MQTSASGELGLHLTPLSAVPGGLKNNGCNLSPGVGSSPDSLSSWV